MLLTSALIEVEQARDPAQHRQADSRLHLALATASGSRMLLDAVTAAQSMLHDMLQAIPVLDTNIAHSDTQHRAIVQAVLERDPGKARRVMEAHCDDTAALLRGLLDLN
jgi:GntR family transcriptional repressor for pyruvate dehydrogenase complex